MPPTPSVRPSVRDLYRVESFCNFSKILADRSCPREAARVNHFVASWIITMRSSPVDLMFGDIASCLYPSAISPMAPMSPASARATVPVLDTTHAGGASFASAPPLLPTSDARMASNADLSLFAIDAGAPSCAHAKAAAKAATTTSTPEKHTCFILVFLSSYCSFFNTKSYTTIRRTSLKSDRDDCTTILHPVATGELRSSGTFF